MQSHEKMEALNEVSAGRLLHDIRFNSGSVAIRGIREGVVPDSNPLSNPDTRTFVATNSEATNCEELVVALRTSEKGEAVLSLEPLAEGVENNVPYLRAVLKVAAQECNLRRVVADPETTAISSSILERIGFHAMASGQLQLATA